MKKHMLVVGGEETYGLSINPKNKYDPQGI
jgi:hypothetical protein